MARHVSIPIESAVELLNITPYNPLISHCDIKVCYVDDNPNRNQTAINKETGIKIAASLPGCPIVGFYNEEKKDFEGHKREIDTSNGKFRIRDLTRPYGYVDSTAKIWFQKFLDDGIEHEYLMTEGFLWTSIYEEAKEIIEKGKGQSMELDNVEGVWADNNNEVPTFFIINDALIQKLCILGDDVEPCFEGAGIAAQFSLDNDFKQKMYSFMEDIKQALNKGGLNPMPNEDNKLNQPSIEEPEKEFKKKPDEEEDQKKNDPSEDDSSPKDPDSKNDDDNKDEEDEEKKKPKVKHSLNIEEQPEYVELLNKFTALQTEAENLKTSYANLEEEVKGLRQFKLVSERKEKEDLINNTFYMLSATDKADVITNIDSYSLDQIEAKLAIICVRNKVNFNLDNDKTKDEGDTPKESPIITYSLDGTEDGDTAPAWIKAVRETAKNL